MQYIYFSSIFVWQNCKNEQFSIDTYSSFTGSGIFLPAGLMDRIDRNSRLIAVKGSRGVGKTNFLLDYSKEYHPQDNTCLYVNVNNLFIVNDGLFHFVEHFYKLGGKVLLLDQAHKYPEWVKNEGCYVLSPICRLFLRLHSIVRIKSNAYLENGVVDM